MTKKQWSEISYLGALVLWLIVALIKYTYFKDMLPMKRISDPVMYFVLLVCLVKCILDKDLTRKNIVSLLFTILFAIIAWKIKKLQFAAMFVLIYSGRNVPFRKTCKAVFSVQVSVFLTTTVCSRLGILEDVIWEEGTRLRHGLGFTHCMLASHFGLFTAITWIAIRKRLDIISAVAIAGINCILFYLTKGRSDFGLSLLLVAGCLLIEHLPRKEGEGPKWLAYILSAVPWCSLAASIGITWAYREGTPVWDRMNIMSNNRLKLGYDAIEKYGFTWFGQRIKFIGASNLYYKPDAVYNYVDNAYLMHLLLYGTIFILVYCFLTGRLLYRLVRQKEWLMLVCVLISLVFGLVNPQSIYLTYNPLLVLLLYEQPEEELQEELQEEPEEEPEEEPQNAKIAVD